MEATLITGYHGDSSGTAELRGRLWVALDREYAEGYAAGPWGDGAGRVVEVDLSGLRILDLRDLGISSEDAEWDQEAGRLVDPALDRALADALEAAGVDASQVGSGEMHQRVPAIASAVAAAGYDAIAICEWTEGVGETESVCILDYQA
jgi:hypothetical protein